MEYIKKLNNHRIKDLTVVAPVASYCSEIIETIKKETKNRIHCTPSFSCGTNTSLYVFSSDETSENAILYSSIVLKYRSLCNVDLILEYIKENPGEKFSVKKLMKIAQNKSFYSTRVLIEDLISLGLIIKISHYNGVGSTGGNISYLYPYYFTKDTPVFAVIRQLLSVGYKVSLIANNMIHAAIGSEEIVIHIGSDLESLDRLKIEAKKILLSDNPIINYSGIHNYSMSDFLEELVL